MRVFQIVFVFLFTFTVFSQRQVAVDFIRANVEILPLPESKEINGTINYQFELKEKTDSIFLDAVNMTFFHVSMDRKEMVFSNSGKRLSIKAPDKLGTHELFIRYIVKPKQTVYFIDRDSLVGMRQIWTQGQGKYTSHWLPSIDDMSDKMEFDLTILAEEEYQVIANGQLNEKYNEDGLTDWKFDMEQPMSSYLVAFVMGNFGRKVIKSSSGVPIELYYEPKDSLKFEPTYRYTKEIFDFLEKEIGVAYPWQNYKQVPVQDFLYAGMENITCTIFSNQYMIDSTAFVDKNYVNVNAHELAHQWFGNLVTEQSGKHHWLHEGFATYYAYLAEKKLFGDDYFYWKLYETAKTLHNLSENGDGEALTNPNANSLTFYEKGAWALVMLRERVGDYAFRRGIKMYLEKHAYGNVTIDDFLIELETASGQKLDSFKSDWLESETFPWEEVKEYLMKKNHSIRKYFVLKHMKIDGWINDSIPFQLKRQLTLDMKDSLKEVHYRRLLKDENIKVRQTAIQLLEKIPGKLKEISEQVLLDNSYMNKELALFNLWVSFPNERTRYLEKTAETIGLPNKNIRLLWLTLALVTPEFQLGNKKKFYSELNNYTAAHFNFEVRQLAFQYLFQIEALNDDSIHNLVKACDHHVWQFKKSSRNLVRKIYAAEEGKDRFEQLKPSFSEEERRLLETILAK